MAMVVEELPIIDRLGHMLKGRRKDTRLLYNINRVLSSIGS